MENSSSNVTTNVISCEVTSVYVSFIILLPVALGLPVIVQLLCVTFMSKKSSDILNFHLALVLLLQNTLSTLELLISYFFSENQTHIRRFLFPYAQIGGPMNLSLICIERFVAVIHPTAYTLLNTYKCRQVSVAIMWIFVLGAATVSALGPDEYYSYLRKYMPMGVLLGVSVVMVTSSITIARALRQSGPGSDKQHPAKKGAFITVCATSSITLVCYTPVALIQVLSGLSPYVFLCYAVPCSIFILSIAGVVHPLFYLKKQGKLFSCCEEGKNAG